jgi:hypothetical protein
VTDAEILWFITNDDSDPSAWLAQLTRRPSWHSDAACRGIGAATFVLGRGANESIMARARAICDRCTVSEECLDFALDAMGAES